MASAALGFLLVMAVGGAVCGIADLVQGIVARLVSTCVTVTKLYRKSGGKFIFGVLLDGGLRYEGV